MKCDRPVADTGCTHSPQRLCTRYPEPEFDGRAGNSCKNRAKAPSRGEVHTTGQLRLQLVHELASGAAGAAGVPAIPEHGAFDQLLLGDLYAALAHQPGDYG